MRGSSVWRVWDRGCGGRGRRSGGVSDTAGQAVADAYRKPKDLVSSYVGSPSMESLEHQLNSGAVLGATWGIMARRRRE